jgi:hypothetical protein
VKKYQFTVRIWADVYSHCIEQGAVDSVFFLYLLDGFGECFWWKNIIV